MLKLRLLGGASIESESGPLAGPATQRHRIALLSLLARAHPCGIARDKLVAYLWPERDTEHARNLLRQATHALRRALGKNALVSAADELRLDPGALPVDAIEFVEAVEADEAERAVGLWHGPFLDGFFLPQALEFERWVDRERAELRSCYRSALEALARAATAHGDHVSAADWWRRLAADNPCSSRVTLELMRALEAAGDRAEAIRCAGTHAVLLEEQIGAEPETAIAELAKRLRMEPGGGPPLGKPSDGTDAPARTGGPAKGEMGARPLPPARLRPPVERGSRRWRTVVAVSLGAAALAVSATYLWSRGGSPDLPPGDLPAAERLDHGPDGGSGLPSIAVLAFDDLSPEGNQAWFADGIAEEILHALTRLDGLQVTARQSSFAFRNRAIDVRRIADTLAVGLILEGSVRRGGDSVWVTVQLVDGSTGFHRWSRTYAKAPTAESLRAIQEEVAREVAAALSLEFHDGGELEPGVPPDEAYERYLAGRSLLRRVQTEFGEKELLRREDLLRSIDSFRQVVTRAPGWAPGWAALGEALQWAARCGVEPETHYPESQAALERAIELDPGHAGAHASLALVLERWNSDIEGAEARYRRALALGGGEAWNGYALLLEATGRYAEAVDAYRHAEAHDPLSIFVKMGIARTLVCAERFAEAIAYAEGGFELGRGPWPLWSLALALERSGRVDEALERIDRMTRDYPEAPSWDLARALLHARAGRAAEARALLAGLDPDPVAEPRAHPVRAATLIALGETGAATRLLQRWAKTVSSTEPLDCRYTELHEFLRVVDPLS